MIPTQSSVSGPLAALMQLKQAEQALKQQGANPLVPSTGQVSVAGQAIQSAQALTQPLPPPQPQPQMGIQNLRPGIQQQAAMQARAQQPVTQQQLAQTMQRMQGQPAGQPAGKGIVGLPADVNMAEGGIVGFSGQEGSLVPPGLSEEFRGYFPDPEAEALDALRVEEARRRRAEAETPKAPKEEPPLTVVPDPQQQMAMMQKLIAAIMAGGGGGKATPDPLAGADLAGMLRTLMGERAAISRRMEPSLASRPPSPEQIALDKAQEEGIATSRARVEERERRFLESERARAAAGMPTPRQELARFLKGIGGAPTFARGLTRAGKEQSTIEEARRKDKQAALDRARQYKDLMDDQRESIVQRDIAIKQGRMDRAKAEQDRIDANARGLAALEAQLRSPELSAVSQLLGIQSQTASADRRAAEANRARAALGIAKLMQPAKAPPGMSMSEFKTLEELVGTKFDPQRPSPEALQFLARLGNGPQLIRDIQNGNIKPNSEQWNATVVPAILRAKELYKRSVLSQTKYGAPAATPYSQALADAED